MRGPLEVVHFGEMVFNRHVTVQTHVQGKYYRVSKDICLAFGNVTSDGCLVCALYDREKKIGTVGQIDCIQVYFMIFADKGTLLIPNTTEML